MPSYLLLFLSFFLPPLAAISSNCPASRPCGTVEIPYPFGVGLPKDCLIDPSFEVFCNYSTSPPKAYLKVLTSDKMNPSEVIKIDVSNSQVWLNYKSLAGAAFDDPYQASEESPAPSPGAEPPTDEREGDWNANKIVPMNIDLHQTLFTLSEINSITFIGCDDFMSISGIHSNVYAGCTSVCVNNSSEGKCDGSYGNGCCQFPIRKGTANLSLKFTDMHEHSRNDLKRLFRWSYAFIGENRSATFSYNVNTLNDWAAFQNNYRENITRPLILDWRMCSQNCTPEFKNNSSPNACKINSQRVNFTETQQGYTCRCNDGYEGNPYVSDPKLGCLDINECSNSTNNGCKWPSRCKNIPGGYNCTCPIGYKKTDDKGCSPSQIIIATIGVGSGIGIILFLAICYWLHNIIQKTKDKKRRQ